MAGQQQGAAVGVVPAPWRAGNRFVLLEDGAGYFPAMLRAIEVAQHCVLLEMYLVESGAVATQFIEAFAAAVQRGVRVCLLLDAFGAMGLSRADRRRLLAAGVELRFYNPLRLVRRFSNLMRDHRKLLVCDGRVAFVGGVGLTDDFGTFTAGGRWHDFMVSIEGPVLADWQEAFLATWRRCGALPDLPDLPEALALAASGGALGRAILSEARAHSRLANSVVQRIEAAAQRVWIMSAYFVPSRRFRRALRSAARRGVDVRLLLPGARTDHPWVRQASRRFYGKMLRSGVQIFEYQPRMLHAKLVLCDDWLSVGSSNLDRWSFRWNLEANQEIDDAGVSAAAAAIFSRDIGSSRAMNRHHWRQRAWVDRLRENIAGAIDRALDRWRH
ncbi:MAG: phosphatidylserine/phosphatidylglycerophosphate/cardiolipin synthase family protein [Proteobacteria bacterium]|nr:phosphatidylserine/phosphatidylglycerophosphate/cardiolipin synthase family protein [Pseudomonadota bacterium]